LKQKNVTYGDLETKNTDEHMHWTHCDNTNCFPLELVLAVLAVAMVPAAVVMVVVAKGVGLANTPAP
jgi:hypothetical protein